MASTRRREKSRRGRSRPAFRARRRTLGVVSIFGTTFRISSASAAAMRFTLPTGLMLPHAPGVYEVMPPMAPSTIFATRGGYEPSINCQLSWQFAWRV